MFMFIEDKSDWILISWEIGKEDRHEYDSAGLHENKSGWLILKNLSINSIHEVAVASTTGFILAPTRRTNSL